VTVADGMVNAAVWIVGENEVEKRLLSGVNPIGKGSQRSACEVKTSVGILKRNPLF
jgi:hypothetical protein